ncbi:CopD family protein [Xanthobacteraceae bacterium Astr-EGSB]|uniref:CopD family protein n=1 Tax=Astrobacterium formosum TaxID=3069710 RepID=UPI0027ADF954|nr:CopD family protein [Xanthobacteraceae bacterium Astr-EGSB]
MIVWAKAIHMAAIMVWCAGLTVLPLLYAKRNGLRDDPLHDLHRFTRSVFIHVTSPAAFVAVIAGTLLVFLRNVFTAWMALKLVAVGVLVAIHVWQGHVILYLFEPGRFHARWRQCAAAAATVSAIAAVLFLVLAKPIIDLTPPPRWQLRPGGLQSLLETIIPIP